MKLFVSAFLGLALGLVSAFGQAGSKPAPVNPPAAAVAEAPGKDQAVTRLNGPGTPFAQANKAAAAKPGAGYEAPKAADTTLWSIIENGGWVVWVLAAMSFVTVMMILVFLFTLRRSAILTSHYMNTADVLLKKRDYLGLLAISSRHSEAVARVVQRTLDFATKNPSSSFEVVKDVAESEGSAQAASLQHRVTYLADIGTLSPMVGLFGTVLGIIKSFGSLGSGMVSQNRDWALASGVSEALIATGAGLIIGIVAFMGYAFFRNKVQRLISDLEVASAHIVGLIALNYNKKRETSRAAMDDEF